MYLELRKYTKKIRRGPIDRATESDGNLHLWNMSSLEKKLNELIEESYGTPEVLAQQLDLAVEMLFYLEEDVFAKLEVQNVVASLRGVVGVLREE